MRIAIDFDGVIHDHLHPPPGKRMGPPIQGALEAVRALRDAGHDLTIFTARADDIHVRAWLNYFGFPPLPITNVKGDFDLLIDDRAMHFDGDWAAALQAILLGPIQHQQWTSQERSPSENGDVVREV